MRKVKIAVTGGIGSGKSTVGRILQTLGYPVFSCDDIYKEITLNDKEYLEEIEKNFPGTTSGGKLLKKKLAEIVFSDQKALSLLNSIAHPRILSVLNESISAADSGLVFAEVQLLFEARLEEFFHKVIVVLRDKEERIRSVMTRDRQNRENVCARIVHQYDYDAFLQKQKDAPDDKKLILLFNDGDLPLLEKKVKEITDRLEREL